MATIADILHRFSPKKVIVTVGMLAALAFPVCAEERGDSVFTFQFTSGKDMFIVPVFNNGEELERLCDYVELNKGKIEDRKISLKVDGYYVSQGSNAENPGKARTRSNRVKSELITRKRLKEDNFITRNHPGDCSLVKVSIVNVEGPVNPGKEDMDAVSAVVGSNERNAMSVFADSIRDATETEAVEKGIVAPCDSVTVAAVDSVTVKKEIRGSIFALKTNMLGYAVLMPNIELEWMFRKRWSVAAEWQCAWWARSGPHKVYRIGTVIPEVRYWPMERKRWHGMYVGLFVGGGLYDLSNGKKGHEGEGALVGVSAGYMWPMSRYFSLEAGLGVGYLRARDKEYRSLDGHYLYQLTRYVNYFGPLRLKFSLVWRIPG